MLHADGVRCRYEENDAKIAGLGLNSDKIKLTAATNAMGIV
jgi:hypothetical protein